MSKDYQPRPDLTTVQKRILDATIACLVELGYANTSIGNVAERLKISKGNVQYHFPTKETLFQETIAYIYEVAFAMVRPPIDAAVGDWERIEQFIIVSVAFYKEFPDYVKALRELGANFRPEHHRSYAVKRYEQELLEVAGLFAIGQRSGSFREFDPHIMALNLRQVLNGIAANITQPGYNFKHHTSELVELFRRGVCRDSKTSTPSQNVISP